MKLLSVLMPRERYFFTLFNHDASLVVEGSKALIEMLEAYDNDGQRETLGRLPILRRPAGEV